MTALAVGLSSALCLLGVGTAGAEQVATIGIPAASGPHRVGTRTIQLVDRSRSTPGEAGPRRLMVQVTYPRAKKRPGPCRPARYMAPGVEQRLLEMIRLESPVEVTSGICDGGVVMRRRSPLLIFSHAYTANRGVYASLITDLASRGFVVAAIDHPPDAFAVEYPGGRVVDGEYGSPLGSKPVTEDELVGLTDLRVRDVRFTIGQLMRRTRKNGSWLRARIDRSRIGALGHSLGGATAARAATLDRRVRAMADVDGSLFGSWADSASTRKPFLLLTAETGLASVLPRDRACRFYGNAAGPKLAWQLDGGAHLTFSDFQALAPQVAETVPSWPFASLYPMLVGSLDPPASVRSQRRALARFFNRYVKAAGKRGQRPAPPVGISSVTADRLACD